MYFHRGWGPSQEPSTNEIHNVSSKGLKPHFGWGSSQEPSTR